MPRPLLRTTSHGPSSPGVVIVALVALVALAGGLHGTLQTTARAAASFTVNSTGDGADANTADGVCNDAGGSCTLRAAIQQANATAGADTINFSVNGTVTLSTALPYITDDLTINGPGPGLLTVARSSTAATNFNILIIDVGRTVNIAGLTLTGGKTSTAGDGGGLYNLGVLTINGCTISGNTAGAGGGIANSRIGDNTSTGDLTIVNSTISDNSSADFGGGINNGGALTIINSTISGNHSNHHGGGVRTGGGSGVSLTVVNSTITNNYSDYDDSSLGSGGGIDSFQSVNILRNTIVAGNFRQKASPVRDDLGGRYQSTSSHNLIGVSWGPGIDGLTNGLNGNKVGAIDAPLDPRLGPLGANGGPMPAHALLPDSPAVNAGDGTLAKYTNGDALTTDQRGAGFPRAVGSAVDIGAVEMSYAISVAEGSPQSAIINTAFGTRLKAAVTESGAARAGIPVTFTAPAGGASCSFADGVKTVTVDTDDGGGAVAPAMAAGATAGGPYAVTAALHGGAPAVTFALTNIKASQTITFGALPNRTFGDENFTVTATASSGLGVSFAASGNCNIAGSVVQLTGAGSCTITASQAGDAGYNAAADAPRTFQIAKAGSTTTVSVSDATFDGSPHGGTATVAGFGGLSQSLTVTYAGRNSTAYGPSTTAPTNAGEYTAAASFGGGSNHGGSSDSKNFTIAKAGQTITFDALPDKTYGDVDFTVRATASSNLPVSFGALGSCTVSGSTVHITDAGSCRVTATQFGNANYNGAAAVSRDFRIAQASTSVAVSSTLNPSRVGQPVSFIASVTSPAGPPPNGILGVVNFFDGGVAIPNCASLLSPSGRASCTTSALSAGRHTITAEYGTISPNFTGSAGALPGGQTVGGVFEFAQAAFAAGERDGAVAVTVRRLGDATQAAAVAYATDDGTPSAAAPCSSVTGIALERCDYTRAQGLLQFAPGEAEKTFSVLVNTDSYPEGTESTHIRLSNPTAGATLGEHPSATVNISDDTQQTSNPLADTQFFVRQHYHDFLNREPDADGLAFWTDNIESCGADAACREVKRINTSAAFFLSIEFQETGYLAYRMYKAAYGDDASPNVEGAVPAIRLREFLADARRIGQGVQVNVGNWEELLEANKVAYAEEFVQRQRFKDAYPSTLSAEEFVERLDERAGRVLAGEERAQLVASLGETPGNVFKRAFVLRAVAEDRDLRRAELNRAFVLMQFYGYLRRNPDDPQDVDFRGWKFWLDKLESFNGNFVNAEMVKAFISSDEYRSRFGQ